MATKKTPGTAVMPWEQEMKQAVVAQKAAEKPSAAGIKKISIKGGIMVIDDEEVEGNELDVIVIGAVHENQYYDTEYQDGQKRVPSCFAFSNPFPDPEEDVEDSMHAHVKAGVPQGQENSNEAGVVGGACSTCWANKFGSADVGRGKACKNIRRLALITPDGLDEGAKGLKDAEVRMLNVPVMSGKNWSDYVRNVLADEVGRPYYGVVTKVKLVPDRKAQFMLKFELVNLITFDQETYDAMKLKVQEIGEMIVQPYPTQEELDAMNEEAKPAKANSKIGGKAKPGAKAVPMKPVGKVAAKAVAGKARK